MLEKLQIEKCEELKDMITNETEDDDHLNCTSIFPKLQCLDVRNCNKLEFIFPSTLSGGLQKLKYIHILGAEELKHVFARCDDEECVLNENENNQIQIHLPALETLQIREVPKMINICAKKYYMSFPSLQSIELGDLQEFNERSFLHLMASLQGLQLNGTAPKDWMKIIKDVQKLRRLEVSFLKIEEVLDLEGVEIEGPEMTLSLEELLLIRLSELRHIWKGPKYILSLPNLYQLHITSCKKLRVIFSVSIVKSLPQLHSLRIKDCDELVDIIEESDEDHLHQICFPKLVQIHIRHCNSLKCLFSISTCGMFPKLWLLKIEEASELEQVFTRKQDDMQKMTKMEEVFPKLSDVTLRKLPLFVTICEGIDLQTLYCEVDDCPKYQGNNHVQEGTENGDSENQAATNALQDFTVSSKDAMKTSVEEVVSSTNKEETVKEVDAKDPTLASEEQALKYSTAEPQMGTTSLHNYNKTEKEVGRAVPDPASRLAATATTSSAYQSTEEILREVQPEDPSLTSKNIAEIFIEGTTVTETTMVTASQYGPSALELEDEQATCEATLPGPLQGLGETEIPIEVPQKTKIPFDDDSIGDIQEDTTATKAKIDTIFIYSQAEGSQSSPSTMSVESIQEETTTMEAKIDTSSSYSRVEDSQSGPSMMTAKETRDTNVQDGPKSEKAEMANLLTNSYDFKINIPMEDNTSLPNVIPSSHHQSQNGAAGCCSPILEIGEIFQLVELKDGEPALLAKALELYPQLRLSRGQRTHRIISFSYRVLVDILVMLATKTPYTITASDRTTLEANLGAATYLGFDKDWIELVRAKVFGIDRSDVLVAEEKISVMEKELEKCDKALECMQKKRMEAKEKLAMVQNEFDAVDTQLFDLLENRRNLVTKMTEFRKITSAKDKPFGI